MGKRAWWIFLLCLFVAATAVDAAAGDLVKGLGRDVKESRDILAKASARLQAGESTHAEIAGLKVAAEKIRASHLLMEERFKARAEKARPLGGKAAQRQETVAAELSKALEELLALIDALPPDGTVSPATLEELKALLDRLVKPKKRPLLGTLPYRHIGYPAREPAASPIVVPAYKGGDRSVTPADTAASAEAPVSAEITALAQSLQWNPVLIYEWVKNNVETEWYFGVMKGAEETLRQKSGNDADQAALLVSLLRASGFPSRYVKGTIEFFPGIDKLKNLTGIDDPLKIAAFFQKAGIPFKPVIAGGTIDNFQVEHVWVESQIPYSNYRGAVIDEHGKSWLGLDTSIKPHGLAWNQPPEIPGFLLEGLRDNYLQAVRTVTPLEFVKAKAEEQLAQSSPGKSWQDLLRTRAIIPDVLNIIPASLQFRQVAITGEYTELPAELKHRLIVSATDNGNELFSITLETHKLSNRRLALRAEPETVEDQEIIDSFGGLDNTPSYLVRLRPVLTLDGERLIVARDGLPMGAEFTLSIDIVTPGGTERVSSSQVTGNLAVIGVVAQKAQTPATITESDDAEAILHKEAIGYIDRWNRAEDDLAALMGQLLSRPAVSIATVGGQIEVAYLLDTPHDFQWQGLFLDAGYRRIETIGKSGLEKEFMRLSSLQGSVLEHRIFEDDLKVDSVSTAKLLELAKSGGTELISIDRTNIDTILPTLTFDAAVKQDIADAVNQNLTVTIPQTEVVYQDWSGIGYLKENRETGEAGWMLSGNLAGGMSSIRKEEWQRQDLLNTLLVPNSVKPNDDPGAIRKLARITASDYQDGTAGKVLPQPLQVLALDAGGRPVVNVPVVFSIIAGDGSLAADAAGAGSATIKEYRVLTGANGVASTYLLLGKQTAASPIYVQRAQTYAIQVGQNLVAARAEIPGGSLSLDKPFEANGFPGDAVKLTKVAASATDEKWGVPGLFAGSVWVQVADEFDNPVSNKQVTFAVKPQQYRAVPPPVATDTVKIINAKLLPTDSSCPGSPSLDCSIAADEIPVLSSIIGANAAVVLGNTEQTDFFFEARAYRDENGKETAVPIDPALFTYHTSGWTSSSDDTAATFLTANIIHHLDSLGNRIDAGKAGTVFTNPLSVTLYRSEEISVPATKDNCSANCYYLRGTGVYQTTRVDNGTVEFTAGQGGGTVMPTVVSSAAGDQPGTPVANGVYSTTLTLGQQPGINRVSIKGSATQPVKRINRSSGELFTTDATDTASASFDIWGVLPRLVPGQWILVNSKGYPTADVQLQFSVLPAEYPVGSMAVRFYENGLWQYMGEVPVKKSGDVLSAGGAIFDPAKRYDARLSLFNAALESDPVIFTVAAIDLDIDSDNKSGVNADGTHKDPVHYAAAEEIEATPGLPGKFIPLNAGDRNGDAIPDFADGYDLQTAQPAENGSAAFIPLLISIPEPIDLAQARLRFHYNASDPAGVTRTAGTDGRIISTPAQNGHIRLWRKDGIQGRLKASTANGGDYLKPGEVLTVGQLGEPIPGRERTWRLYVEGIDYSSIPGEELISVDIDPDGNGPAPFMVADEVRATVNRAVLITDFNRDRTIDDKDKLKASLGQTFYFWVNDDTDSGEISIDSDVPGEKSIFQTFNWEDDYVNGMSDLEDFFPVHLDIRALSTQFPPASFKYILKHEDSALNLVFADLTPAEAGAYLTDASEQGVARRLAPLVRPYPKTYWITKEGVVLNDFTVGKAFLQGAIDSNKGVILVEGRTVTSEPLVLEVTDNGGSKVFTSRLNISIAGVEQMFRHKNLIREMHAIETYPGLVRPGGAVPVPGHPMPEKDEYRGELDRLVPGDFKMKGHFEGFDADNDGTDFVFVHGLNINGKEARGAQTGIFKRLFWSESRARFWGITWYGWDSQKNYPLCFGTRSPKYHHNVRHAYNAGILLKNFINGVDGPGNNATITGHSLGNVVVSTSIQKGMEYGRYFMVNAAVAEEAYIPADAYSKDASLSYVNGSNWYTNTRRPTYHPAWRYPKGNADEIGYDPALWASEWYTLFDGNDVRSTLTWRNYFEKVRTVPKVFAFFSPTDEAFKPFNYNPFALDAPTSPQMYPANVKDWPGFEDVLAEWLESLCFDGEKLGNYAWAMQELLKGRMTAMEGFAQGGWGFNQDEGDGYHKCVTPQDSQPVCDFITPQAANEIKRELLKGKPLFDKNPDNESYFTPNPVLKTSPEAFEQKQMEFLANEIPALTFAAGHRGVKEFADRNNIDIRNKFLEQTPGTPWPRDKFEWRHNDIYNMAYPYTYKLFDDLIVKMK